MFNSSKALISEMSNILGTENVYYQAPESVKMEYPAIRIVRETENTQHADNQRYRVTFKYTLTLITYDNDSEFIEPILALPYCSHIRHYVSEGLHHDIFEIYW